MHLINVVVVIHYFVISYSIVLDLLFKLTYPSLFVKRLSEFKIQDAEQDIIVNKERAFDLTLLITLFKSLSISID